MHSAEEKALVVARAIVLDITSGLAQAKPRKEQPLLNLSISDEVEESTPHENWMRVDGAGTVLFKDVQYRFSLKATVVIQEKEGTFVPMLIEGLLVDSDHPVYTYPFKREGKELQRRKRL